MFQLRRLSSVSNALLSCQFHRCLGLVIVIFRNWLGNQANFKGTNKDQNIYVGRSTTLHNLLFCSHTLWLNYVTVTFLLVSSLGTNHDLLCLCRVMAKNANKNIEQRILQSFITIYLYKLWSRLCPDSALRRHLSLNLGPGSAPLFTVLSRWVLKPITYKQFSAFLSRLVSRLHVDPSHFSPHSF